jgi:hypothetical protein
MTPAESTLDVAFIQRRTGLVSPKILFHLCPPESLDRPSIGLKSACTGRFSHYRGSLKYGSNSRRRDDAESYSAAYLYMGSS